MLIVDASCIVHLVARQPVADGVRERILGDSLHAPHLLDIEVANALGRLNRLGTLDDESAAVALRDFEDFSVHRHEHDLLLSRIWELRRHLTACDAAYVALAEVLHAPLVTADAKLARSHGHSATIELMT